MNPERVSELRQQVTMQYSDIHPEDTYPDQDHRGEIITTFLERFAELIVRECADYAFSDEQDRRAMLKHFGVES